MVNLKSIGLIFLVPGIPETLRVTGKARICTDSDILAEFEVRGKVPKTGIMVMVEEVLFQCSKALIRSRLWEDDYRVERGSAMPPLGNIIKDQIGSQESAEELEGYVQKVLKNVCTNGRFILCIEPRLEILRYFSQSMSCFGR